MENIKNKGMAGSVPVYCAYDAIIPINEIIPNPLNPNQHPEEQIDLLEKIIKAQGWRAPITVSTRSGMVVRGHGRLLAAIKAGLSHAPVDYQEYKNEDDEFADLVADNKIAELAEIDNAKLAEIFKSIDATIVDAGVTGFTAEEVAKISEALVYTDVTPDDFGEEFSLNDSETPLFRTMTFHLDEEQYAAVIAVFEAIKKNGDISDGGNSNENGKCLYKVVKEWAEQKKLSLR